MRRPALALALGLLAAPVHAQQVDVIQGDGPDLAAGAESYVTYCASCHGMEGRGNGPMAPILAVLPTDLTRLAEMNEGAFPWMRIARQIDGRDPFLAHGGVMPLFGDYFTNPSEPEASIKVPDGQPLVTTRSIAELLVYLESIQE